MKTLIILVFGAALLGLASALQCYTCDKGVNCDKTQVCTSEDSCLSLTAGSVKYKQCLKYDDCTIMKLRQLFPNFPEFKFSCCTANLCNTASLSVARNSLVGLLLSVMLFWWWVL